jgi:hypothetical protein
MVPLFIKIMACYKEYYPCPYDPNEKNILI